MGIVEAIGAARDRTSLAVESLGSAVREARGDVGDDALRVLADRGRDALEGFEPRTSRPTDPLVELDPGQPLISAVENADQGILESGTKAALRKGYAALVEQYGAKLDAFWSKQEHQDAYPECYARHDG